MPDENRVFDISKPGSTNAHPSGRPVIVGHHPAASDPMVRSDSSSSQVAPTHILVQDSSHHNERPDMGKPSHDEGDTTRSMFAPVAPTSHPVMTETENHSSFGDEASSQQDLDHAEPNAGDYAHIDSSNNHEDFSGNNPDKGAPNSYSSTTDPQMPAGHLGDVEGIHLPPKKHDNKTFKVLIVVVLLAIAGYLFIDSGVVNTGINLPFHIFKQKTKIAAVTASPPPAAPPAAPAAVVPAGFSQYKITGTNVTFAAPTVWGQPTSSTDKGFSSRTSSAQPDSTYAFLVDFPNNKDVQMAVTSSKYLPPARTTLYYDFLQWCTGTSDGKYYFSVLKFTTTDKVDTPSTITCDQGPLTNPTKLDDATIVQIGIKDASGKPTGDIYTKNLTSKDLPVLRVKDTSSSNADNIKKLLNTVKEQS